MDLLVVLEQSWVIHRGVDETHATAKAQLVKMAKLRTVFGLPANQDSKEGESFDRELQEQRKRDREMEKDLREKTKVKNAKALKKEIKRKQEEGERAAKKAEKAVKKQEKQRQKVNPPVLTLSLQSLCTAQLADALDWAICQCNQQTIIPTVLFFAHV